MIDHSKQLDKLKSIIGQCDETKDNVQFSKPNIGLRKDRTATKSHGNGFAARSASKQDLNMKE